MQKNKEISIYHIFVDVMIHERETWTIVIDTCIVGLLQMMVSKIHV